MNPQFIAIGVLGVMILLGRKKIMAQNMGGAPGAHEGMGSGVPGADNVSSDDSGGNPLAGLRLLDAGSDTPLHNLPQAVSGYPGTSTGYNDGSNDQVQQPASPSSPYNATSGSENDAAIVSHFVASNPPPPPSSYASVVSSARSSAPPPSSYGSIIGSFTGSAPRVTAVAPAPTRVFTAV